MSIPFVQDEVFYTKDNLPYVTSFPDYLTFSGELLMSADEQYLRFVKGKLHLFVMNGEAVYGLVSRNMESEMFTFQRETSWMFS